MTVDVRNSWESERREREHAGEARDRRSPSGAATPRRHAENTGNHDRRENEHNGVPTNRARNFDDVEREAAGRDEPAKREQPVVVGRRNLIDALDALEEQATAKLPVSTRLSTYQPPRPLRRKEQRGRSRASGSSAVRAR